MLGSLRRAGAEAGSDGAAGPRGAVARGAGGGGLPRVGLGRGVVLGVGEHGVHGARH